MLDFLELFAHLLGAWSAGFFGSLVFVVPLMGYKQVADIASAAGGDIRC